MDQNMLCFMLKKYSTCKPLGVPTFFRLMQSRKFPWDNIDMLEEYGYILVSSLLLIGLQTTQTGYSLILATADIC